MRRRRRIKRAIGIRRTNKHTHDISSQERLNVHFVTVGGKVESFGVCYEYLFEGKWTALKYCDNSHDTKSPHCHVYALRKGEVVENDKLYTLLPDEDPAKLLTQVIDDLKRNRVTILSSFKLTHERDNKNRK